MKKIQIVYTVLDTIEVSDELYEVIKRSQENKKPTDEIFDMVDSGDVGNFLN